MDMSTIKRRSKIQKNDGRIALIIYRRDLFMVQFNNDMFYLQNKARPARSSFDTLENVFYLYVPISILLHRPGF